MINLVADNRNWCVMFSMKNSGERMLYKFETKERACVAANDIIRCVEDVLWCRVYPYDNIRNHPCLP